MVVSRFLPMTNGILAIRYLLGGNINVATLWTYIFEEFFLAIVYIVAGAIFLDEMIKLSVHNGRLDVV
jgi:hypothetical protein